MVSEWKLFLHTEIQYLSKLSVLSMIMTVLSAKILMLSLAAKHSTCDLHVSRWSKLIAKNRTIKEKILSRQLFYLMGRKIFCFKAKHKNKLQFSWLIAQLKIEIHTEFNIKINTYYYFNCARTEKICPLSGVTDKLLFDRLVILKKKLATYVPFGPKHIIFGWSTIELIYYHLESAIHVRIFWFYDHVDSHSVSGKFNLIISENCSLYEWQCLKQKVPLSFELL